MPSTGFKSKKQSKAKHVESTFATGLDAGSTPADSTQNFPFSNLNFPLGLREGAGGKPARAEAAGDAAAKKRACKLFLPPCVPTACARGLGTEDRPRA